MKFSWDMAAPRLVLIADTDDFDDTIIRNFKDEGYDVTYMPFDGDKKAFRNRLSHLADPLDLGEKYAIVGPRLRSQTPLLHSTRTHANAVPSNQHTAKPPPSPSKPASSLCPNSAP